MNLLLISDAFWPMRTSAAVHMQDLAHELNIQGHKVTILVPSQELLKSIKVEHTERYQIISVNGFKTKGVGYIRRLFAEIVNPLLMLFFIQHSNLLSKKMDGIIWYSPSIFFAPLVKGLAHKFNCPKYLICRDLFPKWALDLGFLKEGFIYNILKSRELSQYKVADVIGIQSPGNTLFFKEFSTEIQSKTEVLWTWISLNPKDQCSIDIGKTKLAGRKIFLYSGNMGIAQNLHPFLELARSLKERNEIGFLMVGRGDQMPSLMQFAAQENLENILFYDEINSSDVPLLCDQCCAGIVSLDLRHKTHNIPGKFLTYMRSGLPVLAKINPGNDLIALINERAVGVAVVTEDPEMLRVASERLLMQIESDSRISERCVHLADELFSTEKAAKQIIRAIQSKQFFLGNVGVIRNQFTTKDSVAILLATYNGSKFIAAQLESLESQIHQNWFVVASDDASSDNTLAILRSFQERWPEGKMIIRKGPEQGFCKNFLSMACDKSIVADYYAFCDQDDVWLPTKLTVAIENIHKNQKDSVAYVYCGRTIYVDEMLKKIGDSPLFSLPRTFKNALIQSIAGGNTMVFNQKTKHLLQQAGVVDHPSHDWWVYQLITGVSGDVFYDPVPQVLYRQHKNALVGGNSSFGAKFDRIASLLKGQFRAWNSQSMVALNSISALLSKENIETLKLFAQMRDAHLRDRVRLLKVCGIYRQTRRGTISLIIANIMNKI
jgi:glycosyltransferase involved in cell wall biosynthesis